MPGLAQRLRSMSRDELAWRLRTRIRTHAEEAACALRAPTWDRGDIRDALATETLPPEWQKAMSAGDWHRVHRGLRDVLRARPARFVLDPTLAAELRREIASRWPAAEPDAVRRAGTIAGGAFDLLGYRALSFDPTGTGSIDWHFDPVHRRRMPIAFWSRVPYLDPACGDHKIVWELNRHQHWLALGRALWLTGDPAWANRMVSDLQTWLAANPPLLGANWASMLELAFRCISWSWGVHVIMARSDWDATGEPWLVDLMVALARQLTHVERNLSIYFSPNTHLTGEALALYAGGAAFPELAGSTRWIDTGREVLLHEIDRQIEADGGHAERSTHYHRYTLDFYLLALQTARRIGDVEAEDRFRAALERIVPFAIAMADRQGRLPLIGDDDAGRLWPIVGRDAADLRDSLGVAAAVMDRPEFAPWGITEDVLWLTTADPGAFARALRMDVDERAGDRRTLAFRASSRTTGQPMTPTVLPFPGQDRRRVTERRGQPSRAAAGEADSRADRVTKVFESTGYVTSATRSGDHLVFDVGPHGYLNGGHAHADALAVVLTLRGRPLLVDPGTPTYTMDGDLRDQLRSSINHNTLTIDGASSAIPSGPFHWESRADARLDVVRHNSRFAAVEASHDAYRMIGHRRAIVASDQGYLFVDRVDGSGIHEAGQHWHFDPRWQLSCETANAIRASHETGLEGWLLLDRGDLSLITSDDASSLGWFSPTYGVRVPSWTARLTRRGDAPLTLITWCGTLDTVAAPVMERVACEGAAADAAVAVRIRCGDAHCTTVWRFQPEVVGPVHCAADGIETDARVLQCSLDGGRLASVAIADGRRAHIDGQLQIEADDSMTDLHIARVGNRLELTTTRSPRVLRLQGAALAGVDRIIGNGGELRQAGADFDTVVLGAGEWPTAVSPIALSGSSRCAG